MNVHDIHGPRAFLLLVVIIVTDHRPGQQQESLENHTHFFAHSPVARAAHSYTLRAAFGLHKSLAVAQTIHTSAKPFGGLGQKCLRQLCDLKWHVNQ